MDHLRLSLTSQTLRFSFPVMRSRPADFWHKELAELPPEEMLPRLALVGFEGICIDRAGELAHADLEKKIAERLNVKPIVSPDRQFAYYSLRAFTLAQKAKVDPDEWQRRHEETLHPVVLTWQRGFVGTPEMKPLMGSSWCYGDGGGRTKLGNRRRGRFA